MKFPLSGPASTSGRGGVLQQPPSTPAIAEADLPSLNDADLEPLGEVKGAAKPERAAVFDARAHDRTAAASLGGPARATRFDLAAAVSSLRNEPQAPEAQLASIVDVHLDGLDPKAIQSLINHHLTKLGLRNAAGEWVRPELKVDFKDVTSKQLKDLSWQMAALARHNTYMHKAAGAADNAALGELANLSSAQGVAREAVVFAFVLEKLTQSFATDPDRLDAFLQIARTPGGLLGDMAAQGVSHGIKFSIVEEAVEGIVRALRRGAVAPDEFRKLLQLNINVMAVMDDPDNNAAGMRLSARAAAEGDGHKADAATLDPNSKLIRLSFLADPTEWVSMYNTWNAILGLQSEMSPFFLMKLLIPSVGNFYDDPKAYMHNRVVALYMFMVWRQSGPDQLSSGEPVNWTLPKVADSLARQNLENTRTFEKRALADGFGAGEPIGVLAGMLNRYLKTPELWDQHQPLTHASIDAFTRDLAAEMRQASKGGVVDAQKMTTGSEFIRALAHDNNGAGVTTDQALAALKATVGAIQSADRELLLDGTGPMVKAYQLLTRHRAGLSDGVLNAEEEKHVVAGKGGSLASLFLAEMRSRSR